MENMGFMAQTGRTRRAALSIDLGRGKRLQATEAAFSVSGLSRRVAGGCPTSMRTTMALVTLCLTAGCPRVEVARVVAEPPAGQCQSAYCGGGVAVKTSLPSRTPLTSAECKSVCASIWCDADPIGPSPGCWLDDPQKVRCGAIAYDCGYTFGGSCDPVTCADGCCADGDGSCYRGPGAQSCGGARCGVCKPDAGLPETRCSPGNCAALAACGAQLEGQPRLETCGVDAGFDPSLYCPEVCLAAGAGELLACASTVLAQCVDAGTAAIDVLSANCKSTPDGGVELTCLEACGTVRAECDQRCNPSGTSLESCKNCAAQCGLDWTRCSLTCRR